MGRRKRTIQRRSVCKNNISRKRKRKNNTSKRTKQRKKRTKQRQKRRMVGGDADDDKQELEELKRQIKELNTELLGDPDVPETGGLPRPSGRLPSGFTSTDPREQFKQMKRMNMEARENAAKKEYHYAMRR